jgi:RimJ/RimL family protein N-acetyltransferase
MLVYGHDRELSLWVGERLGLGGPVRGVDPTAVGVARRGHIVAVALFSNFQPPTIEVTFVTTTPRWASREMISGILAYPFVQLGCKRVTAVTEECNGPARAFLERLGFKQEGVHPDAFPSGEGISYGLLRKDAERWL